jgi:hypothetical protein
MVERNNYAVKRTNRSHGLNKQAVGQRAAFEHDRKINPVAVSTVPIYVKPACHLCKRIHVGQCEETE